MGIMTATDVKFDGVLHVYNVDYFAGIRANRFKD